MSRITEMSSTEERVIVERVLDAVGSALELNFPKQYSALKDSSRKRPHFFDGEETALNNLASLKQALPPLPQAQNTKPLSLPPTPKLNVPFSNNDSPLHSAYAISQHGSPKSSSEAKTIPPTTSKQAEFSVFQSGFDNSSTTDVSDIIPMSAIRRQVKKQHKKMILKVSILITFMLFVVIIYLFFQKNVWLMSFFKKTPVTP